MRLPCSHVMHQYITEWHKTIMKFLELFLFEVIGLYILLKILGCPGLGCLSCDFVCCTPIIPCRIWCYSYTHKPITRFIHAECSNIQHECHLGTDTMFTRGCYWLGKYTLHYWNISYNIHV